MIRLQARADFGNGRGCDHFFQAMPLLLGTEFPDDFIKRAECPDLGGFHLGDLLLHRGRLAPAEQGVIRVFGPLGLGFFHSDENPRVGMDYIADESSGFVPLPVQTPELEPQPGRSSARTVIAAANEKAGDRLLFFFQQGPKHAERIRKEPRARLICFAVKGLRVVFPDPGIAVIENALGVATQGFRVGEAPALEVESLDGQKPAAGAALERGQNPQPGLAERQAQPPSLVFGFQDEILITAARRLLPGVAIVVVVFVVR